MALVKDFEKLSMERNSAHEVVQCTYSIFTGEDGTRFIQFDTYGSDKRQIRGKKSQSIQFDQAAIEKLVEIFRSEGLM